MPERHEADTSASLLLRIRDPQDHEAWTTFVNVYSPLVRRYCARKGLQPADAADVAQEVLSRVAKSIPAFDYDPTRGRFRAWFGTLVAHQIATHLSKRGQSPAPVPLVADTPDAAAADPQWNHEFTEHLLAVSMDRIRGEFEPATWEAFAATWVRQEPPANVAAKLGIAIHAVYVNKSRVLNRLQTEILLLAADLPQPTT
ncbi:MAG: sigma-70 family RNA polymerase sigma factor [Fimbriiglobus sp.]|jgi:RNA polymerase sigma-70 factor (ECF subfamily)|nr:sigma-70 family RNA polymerase sigma factor [Fimbriiglobus sp.]